MSVRDGQKCQKAGSGEIIRIPHSVDFMRVTPSHPHGGEAAKMQRLFSISQSDDSSISLRGQAPLTPILKKGAGIDESFIYPPTASTFPGCCMGVP